MWIYSTFLSYFNLTATHTFRRQRKYVKVTNTRFFLPPFCLGSYSTVSRYAQSLIFPNAKERPLGNSWFSRFTFITRPTRWWIYILQNCFPILLFNDLRRWSRKSPAVVIDVKRLRIINGFVHPFAFRKNRLSITLYRSTGIDSSVAWSGSLAILMKSFFILIFGSKMSWRYNQNAPWAFLFRIREKTEDQNAKQSAVRESESGEKNRISLLCKAALG